MFLILNPHILFASTVVNSMKSDCSSFIHCATFHIDTLLIYSEVIKSNVSLLINCSNVIRMISFHALANKMLNLPYIHIFP